MIGGCMDSQTVAPHRTKSKTIELRNNKSLFMTGQGSPYQPGIFARHSRTRLSFVCRKVVISRHRL
jgi:hypothetical protein